MCLSSSSASRVSSSVGVAGRVLQSLEIALLTHDEGRVEVLREQCTGDKGLGELVEVCGSLVKGAYAEVLESECVREVFMIQEEGREVVKERLKECVERFLSGAGGDTRELIRRRFIVFVLGQACYGLYVQSNYTGPALEWERLNGVCAGLFGGLKPFQEDAKTKEEGEETGNGDELHKEFVEMLTVNGEPAYPLLKDPFLLVLARLVCLETKLDDGDKGDAMTALVSLPVWRMRVAGMHQQTLDDVSSSLYNVFFESVLSLVLTGEEEMDEDNTTEGDDSGDKDKSMIKAVQAHWTQRRLLLADSESAGAKAYKKAPCAVLLSDKSSELYARLHLEMGLLFSRFEDAGSAKDCFRLAQEGSKLTVSLTGKMGKRTKFQQKDTAQLFLEAESRDENNEDELKEGSEDGQGESTSKCPKQLELNDDTLLEAISFSEKVKEGNIKVIDQCIILSLCLDVKNHNAKHGLTTEEMFPYVTRVLANANNWMVHTMGLLLKTRLETEKMRTVERAALQLQVLVDQYKDTREETSVVDRMKYFHCLEFPSLWQIRQELGERYMNLGVLRSAVEIFEDLQKWDLVVECYIALEQKKKAEDIARHRVEEERSPKMMCLLGAVLDDISWFERAWECSGQRYGKAMRLMGTHHLHNQNWQQCIECFDKALKINSHNEGVWFSMGCAALRLESWKIAETAFRECVRINTENGEAWNNLASMCIKIKEYRKAYYALYEALKQRFDNWKMWENYLYVSLTLKEYRSAIEAMNRIMDHKKDKDSSGVMNDDKNASFKSTAKDYKLEAVDVECLNVIVNAFITDAPLPAGRKMSNYERNIAKLLGRVVSIITSDRKIWSIYARFHRHLKNHDKYMDCALRSYRCSLVAGWESSPETFDVVIEEVLQLAEAYFELVQLDMDRDERILKGIDQPKKLLYSTKLCVRGTFKKAENAPFGVSRIPELQAVLDKIAELEPNYK
eukprot:Nk52_evm92s208 gene=Nk52_evmTU92s208